MFFLLAEVCSRRFTLFVLLVVVLAFEWKFSRSASFSDSDSLPLDEQSEVMYLPSYDAEVMVILRVRSVGLDDNGKLVQRRNKINSGGEEWKYGGKVLPKQFHLGGLGGTVMGFAQWMEINSLCEIFLAEHADWPYPGTAKNGPFWDFLGYEYKKAFCPRFSPVSCEWSQLCCQLLPPGCSFSHDEINCAQQCAKIRRPIVVFRVFLHPYHYQEKHYKISDVTWHFVTSVFNDFTGLLPIRIWIFSFPFT